MSRELVRHAAADWLTAAEIPGLVKVYPAKLAFQTPQFTASNNAARAMGYVLLDVRARGREKRLAFGGAESGEKQIDHPISLILNFWAPSPTGDADWLRAQDDFDRIFEATLDQIRSGGRTLGRPDAILSAGEAPYNLDYHWSEPVTLGGGTLGAVAEIGFYSTEIITA
jgi:hypothetical protein